MTMMKLEFPILTLAHIDAGVLDSDFFIITPELATQVLAERNPKNRSPRTIKVEQLRSDIENGRFTLNGESIIFGVDGTLLDGQHRLMGARDKAVSLLSLVALGVDPEARITIDQGIVRSHGDVLAFKGTPYGNLVSSIAKCAVGWFRSKGNMLGRIGNVSRAELDEMIEADPSLVEAAAYAMAHRAPGVTTGTVIGFCYWLLTQHYGAEVASGYLDKLTGGNDLSDGEGALAARNRLILERRSTTSLQIEITLRGFVYHYTGRHLRRIQTSANGQFPPLPPAHPAKAKTSVKWLEGIAA